MDDPLVHRTDSQYSAGMDMTQTTVKAYPVGALHMDDDTQCTAPDVCERTVYWQGGAPLHEFGTPTLDV